VQLFLLAWELRRVNAKAMIASDIVTSGFLSISFSLKVPVKEFQGSTTPKQNFPS
jgi:hypothetical protein